MTRTFTIKDGQAPTQEQLDEVKAAAKREIQFDEDSPELSPAMYKAFRCSSPGAAGLLLPTPHPSPLPSGPGKDPAPGKRGVLSLKGGLTR